MEGHFNLSHDSFEAMATDTLRGLATDKEFTDVTLASADNKLIQAHKAIISSYSTVLSNILVNMKKENTVIYLKGVNYEELRSIVNFIYLGETKVKQVNFPNFMQIAQDLNIKGLAVNQETGNDANETEKENSLPDVNKKAIKEIDAQIETLESMIDTDSMAESSLEIKTEKQNTKLDDPMLFSDGSGGEKFTCPHCNKYFTAKGNLKKHIRGQHDGITYDCDICEYKGKQSTNLKYHKKVRHGVVDPSCKISTGTAKCDSCEKTFSDKSNLRRHMKSDHEGVVYPCEFCSYRAKQNVQLKSHIQRIHSKIAANIDEMKSVSQ